MSKFTIKIIIFTIIAIFVSGSFFIIPAKAQTEPQTLESYVAYFYNRYSKHFDEHGYIFKAPDYDVPEFRAPQTAREILNLATYYKYRALKGERYARQKIRQAILAASLELNSRPLYTQSFSDAWVQMTMVSLLDQIPLILTSSEVNRVYQQILDRMAAGILAPDTSNRAALSAVYWQQTVNNFYQKGLINQDKKNELDNLIKDKITTVLEQDVDQYDWYNEGRPMKFNPHYHLITALAFACYGQATGQLEFLIKAKEMTDNLRLITFQNGMVEARIGNRPAGLGAQFYLGAALLNYKFGYDDFAVYLNYAYGDRFFSDPEYPNRLEYHSTIKSMSPDFHDDISFSNLAELALLNPSFKKMKFQYVKKMRDIPEVAQKGKITIVNTGDSIKFNDLKFNLDKSGDYSYLPDKGIVLGASVSIQVYGQFRHNFNQENEQIADFEKLLKEYLVQDSFSMNSQSFQTLADSYIYGGYSLP